MRARLTRGQWLAQFFRFPVSRLRAPKEKRPEQEKAQAVTWEVRTPDGRWCYVQAITRSEARGLAKRALGKLPAGTRAEKA